jgi:hypothetical protein
MGRRGEPRNLFRRFVASHPCRFQAYVTICCTLVLPQLRTPMAGIPVLHQQVLLLPIP